MKELNADIDGEKQKIINAIKLIENRQLVNLYNEIVNTKKKSKSIYVLGTGSSVVSASHFATGIQSTTHEIKTSLVQSGIENFSKEIPQKCSADDLIIAISASGNSPEVISTLKEAKENGCRTIGIGGWKNSQIIRYSDYHVDVNIEDDFEMAESLHLFCCHIVTKLLKKSKQI